MKNKFSITLSKEAFANFMNEFKKVLEEEPKSFYMFIRTIPIKYRLNNSYIDKLSIEFYHEDYDRWKQGTYYDPWENIELNYYEDIHFF